MKLHDYLESEYVSTNISNQITYHPYKQAKITAVQSLIHGQKTVYKYVAMIQILTQYVAVISKLISAPKTSTELVKELNESKRIKEASGPTT